MKILPFRNICALKHRSAHDSSRAIGISLRRKLSSNARLVLRLVTPLKLKVAVHHASLTLGTQHPQIKGLTHTNRQDCNHNRQVRLEWNLITITMIEDSWSWQARWP